MPSEITGHVSQAEWRWVILISVTFLLVSFLPFLVFAGLNPGADWQFMGAIHRPTDAAASMSRIVQGAEGYWLVDFVYTAAPQEHALIEPVYPLLGRLSQATLRSPVTIFHSVRLLAGFFMYLAIYQLAAAIWVKVRARREFFILAAVGSGLGWLAITVFYVRPSQLLDILVPQAFPFYAGLINVHFPLAIMSLSLLVAALLPVFRPGEVAEPGVNNNALMAFLTGMVLSLVYPDALLPVSAAFLGTMIVHQIEQGRITQREWRWGLWVLVPALPIVAYLFLSWLTNPVIQAWIVQRSVTLPSLWMLPVGIGLPLLVALPGLWRAVTKFEPDGDRFMLLWLVAMLGLAYLTGLKQSLLIGLMLPVAYFATRALEDVWLPRVNRLVRRRLYIVLIPLVTLSNLLMLILPLFPVLNGWQPRVPVLNEEYMVAMNWLEPRTTFDDVVLASDDVAMWLPVWAKSRTVYGHPAETINADEARQAVREWYTADNLTTCDRVLDDYRVSYVIVGPAELQIGDVRCTEQLELALSVGAVDVYRVPPVRLD
jgi:hypothetical protein